MKAFLPKTGAEQTKNAAETVRGVLGALPNAEAVLNRSDAAWRANGLSIFSPLCSQGDVDKNFAGQPAMGAQGYQDKAHPEVRIVRGSLPCVDTDQQDPPSAVCSGPVSCGSPRRAAAHDPQRRSLIAERRSRSATAK